jgi:hypothetical protein
MGKDFWSCGVEAERRELAAVSRYAVEQGIIDRQLPAEESFGPHLVAIYLRSNTNLIRE